MARRRLSELLSKVKFNGVRVVITRYGQPAAVLISIEDYRKLNEMADPPAPGEVRHVV